MDIKVEVEVELGNMHILMSLKGQAFFVTKFSFQVPKLWTPSQTESNRVINDYRKANRIIHSHTKSYIVIHSHT